MKAGERIYVRTNYELLNKLLNKNLGGWMKSIYKLSEYPKYYDTFIWMVCLDGTEHKGWINNYYGTSITEDYIGGKPYPNNIYTGLNIKKRFVFEKVENASNRYYIFRGLYELDPESSLENRVLKMICNETNLF